MRDADAFAGGVGGAGGDREDRDRAGLDQAEREDRPARAAGDGASAAGKPAPASPGCPRRRGLSSAAPAISAPLPKIAASTPPAIVSQRPWRDVAGVMPLSAEALCWKKIIHGVTVAPIVEAQQQQQRVELPPGSGEKVERAARRAPESGLTRIAATQEQAVEEREAEHDPLPAPVAPAAEREEHEHEPERGGDAGAEVEVGEADADRDELGDQRDEVREQQVAGAEPAPHLP